MTIKIKSKELRRKSNKELYRMKKILSFHLIKANGIRIYSKDFKGFDVNEERKNIARINTILTERDNAQNQ